MDGAFGDDDAADCQEPATSISGDLKSDCLEEPHMYADHVGGQDPDEEFFEKVVLPRVRALLASGSCEPSTCDKQGLDLLDDLMNEKALQDALNAPILPFDRMRNGFRPAHEDIKHVADQLACSDDFATATIFEVNLVSVTSQLRCSREWASELMRRHDWEPFVVLRAETNLNALEAAHMNDPDWELTELRTTWGSLVPVDAPNSKDTVICVYDQRIRVLDEDYLTLCWDEAIGPLPPVPRLRQSKKLEKPGLAVCSTAASSGDETNNSG
jgi:hypothetical protein